MREWLSGGVSPCQGEGRGFESRLALFLFPGFAGIFVFYIALCVEFLVKNTVLVKIDTKITKNIDFLIKNC